MALTKTWTVKAGRSIKALDGWINSSSVKEAMVILAEDVSIPNAYIAVEDVFGTKESVNVKISVFTSSDRKTKIDKSEFDFAPSMDGANFIAQAYEHIKTLPEFSNAQDC
jgi:hypothetical protein